MRIKKTILTIGLTLSLALTGTLQGAPVVSLAALATRQEDEYAGDATLSYIKTTMNKQLIAALSGSSGTRAKITSYSKGGYKSQVAFTFKRAKIDHLSIDSLLAYVEEAIDENPNFCTLSTNIQTIGKGDTVTMNVYSVLSKDAHASAIRRYKKFLANIEYVPREASQMSDKEILLYLHDRLIQHADYATDLSDPKVYIPYKMSADGTVVCQSYASVLNHLMRDLGFTSYAVTSETHAWNVVKLSGGWTCIDATWDDPTKHVRSHVSHENFLVALARFRSEHIFTSFMNSRFPGLAAKAQNEFNSLPKSNAVYVPVCYRTGVWFYVKDGCVYRWDGTSSAATRETAIPQDANRCVNVIHHSVYVGGSDGLYSYDPDTGALKLMQGGINVEGLFYYDRALYYRVENEWKMFTTFESEVVTYETLNGTDNIEKYTLVKPGKPEFIATKSSAKSIRVVISSPAQNANAGYQIQIAHNPDFTVGKKSKNVSGMRVNITGLTKGKTYYIRIRGIWKSGYLKKYGKWSVTRKGTM